MHEQLTMLDTMFLELEQRDETAHMHIGAALVFEPLPGGGTPSLAQVREHVRTRVGGLPRFAAQLSGTHAGRLRWLTWEPTPAFDVEAHVHGAALAAPGGTRELHDWLGDFWSHRLDRHRPLWEITLLTGLQDGRWALATKTHHCLVDGVGSLDIGHLLLDLTPDAPPSPAPPLPADVSGDEEGGGRFWLSPGLVVRGAHAGLNAVGHPVATLARARAAVDLIVRDEVVAAPRSSLNGPLSGTRHFASVPVDLAEVKAIKNHLGGTVNDVVLAVCAGALRHLLLSRAEGLPNGGRLRAQVPVNIRPEERRHALGNELTSLFVELPVGEPDPLVRYRHVVERAERLKAGTQRAGGKAILDVADLGPPLAGGMLAWSMFGTTRMFNLTITNVPGPQRPLYAFGARLRSILPLVPLFAGHAVGIAVVSYDGEMVFGLNADRLAAPDLAILAEGVEQALDELREARR